MRILGVKFLLAYNHFLQVPMSEENARKIVADWLSGAYKLRGESRIGDPTSGWAVDLNSVIGVHFITPEMLQQQPAGALPPVSGYPYQGGWNN